MARNAALAPSVDDRARIPSPIDYVCAAPVVAIGTINLWKVESIRALSIVDPTLLAFGAAAAVMILSTANRPRINRGLFPVIVLCVLFLPGLSLSHFSTDYSIVKNILLFTMVPLLILAPQQLIWNERRLRAFSHLLGLLGISLALLIEFGGTVIQNSPNRVGLEDGNVIGLARVCALGAVCLALTPAPRRVRLLTIPASLICIHAASLTGSRGPVVAALGGTLIGVVMGQRGGQTGLARRTTPFALLAAAAWAIGPTSRIVTATGGETDIMRLDFAAAAWSLLQRYPQGIGWGEFAMRMPLGLRDDAQGWAQYPHNVVLETAVEGGLVAAAGLIYLLWISARAALSEARRGTSLPLALYTASLMFALASSDLTGNRTMWVMIGLCLALPLAPPPGGKPGRGLRLQKAGTAASLSPESLLAEYEKRSATP